MDGAVTVIRPWLRLSVRERLPGPVMVTPDAPGAFQASSKLAFSNGRFGSASNCTMRRAAFTVTDVLCVTVAAGHPLRKPRTWKELVLVSRSPVQPAVSERLTLGGSDPAGNPRPLISTESAFAAFQLSVNGWPSVAAAGDVLAVTRTG